MKRTGIILIALFFFLHCKADPESAKIALLQGAWFQINEENGAFLIKEKSLWFFENATEYKIKLKEKSLEIYEGNDLFITYQIVKLEKHNLWLKTVEGNVLKLIKKK
ncbi:MAG: hypothetical protein V4541_07105 [Bacteroidota bacterium]